MMNNIVIAQDISFSYDKQQILQNANAIFKVGNITALIGPNGVGKTTLLKCIAKLISPQTGHVFVNDIDIHKIKTKDLAKIQSYVPQNSNITFSLSVFDFVCLGRRPYVEWRLTKKDIEIVNQSMEYMKVSNFQNKSLHALSGGEKQRVVLARAIAQEPKVLLLDEPTSALDLKHQLEVMELVRSVANDKHCAIIIVMHDLSLVNRYADCVIMMKEGKIVACGSAKDTITKQSIREVYDVEADIIETTHGNLIVPIKSC